MDRTLITASLVAGVVSGVLLTAPPAAATSTSPQAVPAATWQDCESYARRARTGCLTGQVVQPYAACPAALVGWFTLTKSTSSLVRCKKSGASTKWVWA